jgi:hypothetical protein
MNDMKEAAIVVSLIDSLKEKGTVCSEPQVQKAVFFLRDLVSVPLETSFSIYLNGPYSFGLHRLLNGLRSEDFVSLHSRDSAASWEPGERYPLLRKRFEKMIGEYRPQLNFVTDKVASLDVLALERLSSVLYITRHSGMEPEHRAEGLCKLQRGVSKDAAASAIELLDTWLRDAHEAGFA